jgi:hypothetical protein
MLIPKCAHSFCGMCIRKYLEHKGGQQVGGGECPTCREKVTPDQLVHNATLSTVIERVAALAQAMAAGTTRCAPARERPRCLPVPTALACARRVGR